MIKIYTFRKPKRRDCGYQPRYFNKEEEERKSRLKRRGDRNNDGEITKLRIRDQFREYRDHRRTPRGLWNGSTLRLALIFAILIVIASFALREGLPALMKYIFPNS